MTPRRSIPPFVLENLCRTGGDSTPHGWFAPGANRQRAAGPLLAYVGTFSSPLRDVLPTQVDLPPGNGRGIHLFQVNRATGAMTPAGIHEMGTSPSCLALNAAGTRLYSANETDRVGEDKEGTVSAFAINRADGKLELLNTVRSGGAGPTYVSVHPSGRFVLVANYFGGSVAVLPILADGRLGDATDVKNDAGKIGPTRATNAPPGSFAFSGHDRTHAHMIQADPSGRFVLHVGPGPGQDLRLEVRRAEGRADSERSARRLAATGRRAAAFPFSPQWPLVLLHSGGRLDHRVVRLRCRNRSVSARGRRSPPCHPGLPAVTSAPRSWFPADGRFVYAGNRLHDSIGIFSIGPNGTLTFVGEEWTRGNYPRSFNFDPTGQFLYCCNQRGDNIAVFRRGSQNRRPQLHRPLRPRRQSFDHRFPRSGKVELNSTLHEHKVWESSRWRIRPAAHRIHQKYGLPSRGGPTLRCNCPHRSSAIILAAREP